MWGVLLFMWHHVQKWINMDLNVTIFKLPIKYISNTITQNTTKDCILLYVYRPIVTETHTPQLAFYWFTRFLPRCCVFKCLTVISSSMGQGGTELLPLSVQVHMWVCSRYSTFIPQTKNMHVRVNGNWIIPWCERLSPCVPVTDLQAVQVGPHLMHNDCWTWTLVTPRDRERMDK